MSVTVSDLQQYPGMDTVATVVLQDALNDAYCDNSPTCWGKNYDRAVRLQALAIALDIKGAGLGGSGPITSMSRSMGASGSLSFLAPDKNARGWERNTYGLQYVALRNRVFAGGAMCVRPEPGSSRLPA